MSQKVKEQILFSICAMVCETLERIGLRIKHIRSTVEVGNDGESIIKRPKLNSRSTPPERGQDRCIWGLQEGKFLPRGFRRVANAELFDAHCTRGSSCQVIRMLEFGGGNSTPASGIWGWDLLGRQNTATWLQSRKLFFWELVGQCHTEPRNQNKVLSVAQDGGLRLHVHSQIRARGQGWCLNVEQGQILKQRHKWI